MTKQIENYIRENLTEEPQTTALDFVAFLRENHLTFYKDTCDCWKHKIYYWVKLDDECVCFIAIKDPDEPENLWTVWSDESKLYEHYSVDENVKHTAWKHIDFCGSCGSCSGGKTRIVFGKAFDRVCGCTFRIDNPKHSDLRFLKKMVEIRIADILNNITARHYDILIDENSNPVQGKRISV